MGHIPVVGRFDLHASLDGGEGDVGGVVVGGAGGGVKVGGVGDGDGARVMATCAMAACVELRCR
jgi:hypothetical protein